MDKSVIFDLQQDSQVLIVLTFEVMLLKVCLLTSWIRTGFWLRDEADEQLDLWCEEADKVWDLLIIPYFSSLMCATVQQLPFWTRALHVSHKRSGICRAWDIYQKSVELPFQMHCWIWPLPVLVQYSDTPHLQPTFFLFSSRQFLHLSHLSPEVGLILMPIQSGTSSDKIFSILKIRLLLMAAGA